MNSIYRTRANISTGTGFGHCKTIIYTTFQTEKRQNFRTKIFQTRRVKKMGNMAQVQRKL